MKFLEEKETPEHHRLRNPVVKAKAPPVDMVQQALQGLIKELTAMRQQTDDSLSTALTAMRQQTDGSLSTALKTIDMGLQTLAKAIKNQPRSYTLRVHRDQSGLIAQVEVTRHLDQ